MALFISLAVKSLLVAGATLLLLKLMQKRSASDRSWIAHLGLLALLLLPVGTVALPALEVAGPDFMTAEAATPVPVAAQPVVTTAAPEVAPIERPFPVEASQPAGAAIDWTFWAYAIPAGLLVLLTLIAFGRLIVLKARAEVMVDSHWINALANAQKRMGFKNGTALLTSDELHSPISWGLMRPVILLNTDATQARGEAEAIIAHELAHVAGLDWAKLMLARLAVALFWFNPLAWLLAREAHQLREEAADDAVLGADIEDTEYAKLLVGIARHECRGLLLGAHGVAPAPGSLARRVRRVLDAASARAPGGWRWSSAAAFFAAGMAVPVAALQVVNPTIASAEDAGRFATASPPSSPATIAVASTHHEQAPAAAVADVRTVEIDRDVRSVMADASAGVESARRAVERVHVGPAISVAIASAAASTERAHSAIDRAVELKAVGATPEYVAAMRNAARGLRLGHDDIVQLKAVGVSPDYVRGLASSGYRGLDADEIVQARALGIDGAYIRGMANAGYRHLTMDQLVEMKAVGVTPADAARYRRSAHRLPSVDEMVEMKAVGVEPEDLDSR